MQDKQMHEKHIDHLSSLSFPKPDDYIAKHDWIKLHMKTKSKTL